MIIIINIIIIIIITIRCFTITTINITISTYYLDWIVRTIGNIMIKYIWIDVSPGPGQPSSEKAGMDVHQGHG